MFVQSSLDAGGDTAQVVVHAWQQAETPGWEDSMSWQTAKVESIDGTCCAIAKGLIT
jgi:hypothetical protein